MTVHQALSSATEGQAAHSGAWPGVVPAARRLLHGAPLDFAALRAELGEPTAFPPEVESAARAASPSLSHHRDATHVPLLTVDPAGSRDLDQAFAIERHDDGFVLWYAIADVAAFVGSDGPLADEAWARGETRYCPDLSVPLHPRVLSEGGASLLPGQDRPAALWRIEIDHHGDTVPGGVHVERSIVRSRVQHSYESLSTALEDGTAPEGAVLLAELGPLLLDAARRRDAIDLPIPEQRVVPAGGAGPATPAASTSAGAHTGWTIEYRCQSDVERWNAQLSLTTGMAAATLMTAAGIGIVRTLPPPDDATLARVRHAAEALGIAWPPDTHVGVVLAGIDPATAAGAAFADLAASLFRGASYEAFDGTVPPPGSASHAGIGARYAHVTAPLRRLVDRFGTEICLAQCAGTEVPAWVRSRLGELPARMASSAQQSHALERACIDLTEAWLLHPRVGTTFTGALVDVAHGHGTVALDEPAVRARCDGDDLPLGSRVTVRLEVADVAAREVRFGYVGAAPTTPDLPT